MTEILIRPKNTTKRTGIGCGIIAVLLFVLAAIAILVGFYQNFEANYFIIGATFFAFGVLGIALGLGLFIKGRQVDKMVSGEDLIAGWEYLIDENGQPNKGYVYVGTKGFYFNGLYVSWSQKCVLQKVLYTPGTPPTIDFYYTRIGSYKSGNHSAQHLTRFAVPSDKTDEAAKVVRYYQTAFRGQNR